MWLIECWKYMPGYLIGKNINGFMPSANKFHNLENH